MSLAFLNRCAWTPASAGTGDFVLSAAAAGFYAPADCANPAVIDGATYRYFAVSSDGSEHEEGDGVWDVGTSTLTRANIRNSSNSGSAVDFGAAPTVYMGGPAAADMPEEELLGYVDFAVDGAASVVTLDADLRDFQYLIVSLDGVRIDTSSIDDSSKYGAVQLQVYDSDSNPLLGPESLESQTGYSYFNPGSISEQVGFEKWKVYWCSSRVVGSYDQSHVVFTNGSLDVGAGSDVTVQTAISDDIASPADPVTFKIESLYYDGTDYSTPPNMTSGKIWFYGRRK